MVTQRELCNLHAEHLKRIESKVDSMIEQQMQIRVEIAKLKGHTRIWAAAVAAIFTAITSGVAAALKS